MRMLTKTCFVFRPGLSELVHAAGLVRTTCARPDVAQVMLVLHEAGYATTARRLFYDLADTLRFVVRDAGRQDPGDLTDEWGGGWHVVRVPGFRGASCAYRGAGLSRQTCVDAFDVLRDLEAEKKLLQRIKRKVGNTFVVVHDDEARRIREDALPEGLPRVHVRDPLWRTPCIFDWASTLDHAVHLHAVDSCFLRFAHVMGLRAIKFCHVYTSPSPPSLARDSAADSADEPAAGEPNAGAREPSASTVLASGRMDTTRPKRRTWSSAKAIESSRLALSRSGSRRGSRAVSGSSSRSKTSSVAARAGAGTKVSIVV